MPKLGFSVPRDAFHTITGEGLKGALAGAQVVIDVANSPSYEDRAVLEFFETSERNLLPAEAAAGVRHHVALSIVAIDRTDNGYFRAKVAQEKLIEAAGIPYTIIRATQFLEFLRGIANSSTDGNTVRMPPVLFQPIAADDVAAIVAETALAAPRNGIVEIAGPERAPFNEIIARYLRAVEAGLLGLSGVSGDMRLLQDSVDPRAVAAVEYFVYAMAKYVGAYAAVLGGLDAFVFTAGIGEHSVPVRAALCNKMAWLGVKLDQPANVAGGPRISAPDSGVSVWVIPTNEELMIAQHTLALVCP